MKLNRLTILTLSAFYVSRSFAVNGVQLFTPVVNEAGTLGLHSSSFGEASKLGIGINYNLAVDPAEIPGEDKKMSTYVHSLNLGVGSKLSQRFHVYADLSGHYIAPISNILDTRIKTENGSKFYIGNLEIGIGYSI